MIKKLSKKFVLVSMASLFAVLAVIISGINVISYTRLVQNADEILSVLSENQGRFPEPFDKKGKRRFDEMSPEVPYESRYFSVTLNSETGETVQAETSRIVSVNTYTAIQYAKSALESKSDKGFADHFRFIVCEEGGVTRIIFLDCGRKLDSFYNFLFVSIVISLAGYIAVFIIIAVLSNKIVRPISESYEKQKRFITDAGHEIKTPLTIISADADVLEMECGKNEWIEDIQKQAKSLAALTNDLIYLAKMDEADQSFLMIDFPVSDIVSEAAASFNAPAISQGKTIEAEIEPMLTLKGNEGLISRLTGILLDNAVKYSKKESKITLSLKKKNGFICLAVSNESENEILPETLPLLFDRFYRPDSSRNSQRGGTGIGLSVAKAIVQLHSGKISASLLSGNILKITAFLPI